MNGYLCLLGSSCSAGTLGLHLIIGEGGRRNLVAASDFERNDRDF